MILILKLLCLINETYDIYVYAYGCPNLLPFYCSELITNSILCVSNGYDIICDLPLSSSFILPDNILHIDNLKYNRIVKWDSLKELYKQNKLNFEDHKIHDCGYRDMMCMEDINNGRKKD